MARPCAWRMPRTAGVSPSPRWQLATRDVPEETPVEPQKGMEALPSHSRNGLKGQVNELAGLGTAGRVPVVVERPDISVVAGA